MFALLFTFHHRTGSSASAKPALPKMLRSALPVSSADLLSALTPRKAGTWWSKMKENTSRYVSAIITARRENETSSYDAKTPTSDRVCLPRLLQRCGGKMQHRRSTFAKEERENLQTKRLESLDNKNKKFRTEKTHWPNSPTYPSMPWIHPFARLHNSNTTCTVFCDSMNWNAFVTNSTCRKRANRNPGSRPQRCKIINCKQATFHQTCKTCKNCTTPSFSSRLSQENTSPWQPEHFVIDHLCSRAASKQPSALESLHKRWWWYNFLESVENA